MDVVVCAHVIPCIGTLIEAKKKAQVQVELESYFDELIRVATSPDLVISADTMHQYVAGLTALKTMMCMFSEELDRENRSMYLDAMEARVHFQKYVTIEYIDTITDY